MALVFMVTAVLTLRPFDSPARSSDRPPLLAQAPANFTPVRDSPPTAPRRSFEVTRAAPQPAAPQPALAAVDVATSESQMTTSNTAIADPSTFGTEAAEPIYSN